MTNIEPDGAGQAEAARLETESQGRSWAHRLSSLLPLNEQGKPIESFWGEEVGPFKIKHKLGDPNTPPTFELEFPGEPPTTRTVTVVDPEAWNQFPDAPKGPQFVRTTGAAREATSPEDVVKRMTAVVHLWERRRGKGAAPLELDAVDWRDPFRILSAVRDAQVADKERKAQETALAASMPPRPLSVSDSRPESHPSRFPPRPTNSSSLRPPRPR